MYVIASGKLICYDYIRSYKFFFQKYISRYFFSFFQSVFYCRRCKLFTLSERNWAWHWLYYWLNYFKTLDRGIVGIVKERNVSGGIKRRQSTWLALQGVPVIIPGRILRYLAVAAAQQTWEGQKRGAMLRFSRWAFRYMHLCFFKLSPTIPNYHRIFYKNIWVRAFFISITNAACKTVFFYYFPH